MKITLERVISKEAGDRNASIISEDVYHPQLGGMARGNAGRDRNGTGVKNTQEKMFTAAALLASGTNQGINASCNLCKERGHETPKCPELKRHSVEQRWQSV